MIISTLLAVAKRFTAVPVLAILLSLVPRLRPETLITPKSAKRSKMDGKYE